MKEEIPDIEIRSYKVRLVAKGITQREMIDFTKVFSPLIRHASIRITSSTCCGLGPVSCTNGC